MEKVKAKKHLGQHFLKDESIAKAIAEKQAKERAAAEKERLEEEQRLENERLEKEKQAKEKERQANKHLKVHQKLTHNRKLIEGMKAGLNPDISDDEKNDEDNIQVYLL